MDTEGSTDLLDLFAAVLGNGIAHVMRRGLDRSYVRFEESVAGVRGKIDFAETERKLLTYNCRTFCSFDELSFDVLLNQILKATIRSLLRSDAIAKKNRVLLSELSSRMGDVSDLRLSGSHFRRVQVHRNNAFYGFLIQVCELVFENILPADRTGNIRFRDFLRDDGKMHILFQNFVTNFLKREQSDFRVQPEKYTWGAIGEAKSLSLVPEMATDIVLHTETSRVVIDTKYYFNALQKSEYKETLHSSHLYQLYAYLRASTRKYGSDQKISGLLLYPTVGRSLAHNYVIDGYDIQVRTVNLDQPWPLIHSDLLLITSQLASSSSGVAA